MKKIIFTILLVLWMIIMFLLSNQAGTESSKTSGVIINAIIEFIQSVSIIQIDNLENVLGTITTLVRKGAHLTMYAIGGILAYFTYDSYKKVSRKDLKYIILFMLVFATLDEFHQYFVPRKKC